MTLSEVSSSVQKRPDKGLEGQVTERQAVQLRKNNLLQATTELSGS